MIVMKPNIFSEISLNRCFKITASVAMLMMFSSGAVDLWAQNSSSPSLVGAVPQLHLELLNISLISVAQAGQNLENPAEASKPIDPDREAALKRWQGQVMGQYSFNIDELDDPFLPIKEVRGTPRNLEAEEAARIALAKLPPIERLELSQLKLVAITIMSSNKGAGFASFEDGTGTSYILMLGNRIGRNNGRITKIDQTKVTIEETLKQRGGTKNVPRITVMNLNTLSNTAGLAHNE